MLGKLIRGTLYLSWVLFVILTPLLGVWLASSLVAFYGGPVALAVCGGALLFPILPVWWEVRASRAWKRKLERRKQLVGTPKRSFTLTTRLVARTLFLNLVFLAVLAVWFPKVAFPAVATRGDWFLDGQSSPLAEAVRADLHSAAAGLEWLYELATPNPYKKQGDDQPVPDSVKPVDEETSVPMPTARRWVPGAKWGKPDQPPPAPPPAPKQQLPDGATWAIGDTFWPWELKPADLSFVDESSLESVGKSIAAHESDPFRRVKLLHDWVVTRYRYDTVALEILKNGNRADFPKQDAQSVFSKRVAVCEGYARTLVALGKASGDEIIYVTGDVREEDGAAAPIGHAWNSVQIKGSWYLLDATWDDPVVKGGGETYRTDYLFIPPSLMVYDHLPDDTRWQLLKQPLTKGDFLRQPLARPSLAREGLQLVTPERSTVEVDGPLQVELGNPRGLYVLVHATPEKGGADIDCGVANDAKLQFTCDLPRGQVSLVRLYGNKERDGVFTSIAAIRATRR